MTIAKKQRLLTLIKRKHGQTQKHSKMVLRIVSKANVLTVAPMGRMYTIRLAKIVHLPPHCTSLHKPIENGIIAALK